MVCPSEVKYVNTDNSVGTSSKGALHTVHRFRRYCRRSRAGISPSSRRSGESTVAASGSLGKQAELFRNRCETDDVQGVNMGTRFMCTVESEIHHNIKQKIVDSTEKDTIHIFR